MATSMKSSLFGASRLSSAALPRTRARASAPLQLRCEATATDGAGAGKVAVITGANTGLGKVSATELAMQGYTVVLACRSRERAEGAAEGIRAQVEAAGKAASLDIIDLDLADLASVSDFASSYKSKYDKCDVLLNNAGVMAPPTRQLTKDGFELQIGINHLGHFALTAGLMEPLLESPSSRVVNLASIAHEFGKMNFDNLNSQGLFGYSFLGWGPYGQSKLANILFTYELHRKLRFAAIDSVCTNAVHPGVVDTELSRMLPEPFKTIFDSSGLITPEEGARGQIRVASSAEFEGVSGKYITELAREGRKGEHEQRRSNSASYNMEDAKMLWDMSAELTGAKFDFTRKQQSVASF